MSIRATLLRSVLALVLATLVAPSNLLAQSVFTTGGSTGTDFWITVPPNEIPPFPVDVLEVYIVSEYDTEVTIYDAAADKSFKRQIKAGEIKTLSDRTGETNWTWEIREYEQVVQKGIRITSVKPISVYVLNAKVTTSDGYMALPTKLWGTDYVVSSYYDFKEFKSWAGGFCIVAKENTKVTIALKGTGTAKTSGGKKIGDSFTVNMIEGSVYCVVGDATTRGEFDLTGTSISSTAPIGVFSFHQRTTMPNLLINGNGRDHLVEMTPPISAFGLKTATVELSREGTNPNGKGDVFRVVAAQDLTRWSMKSYDLETHEQIGSGGGILTEAGDFVDISQSTGPTFLTHGFSIWEADKPILVSQLSCSASFDGDNLHDPFMIHLFPLEQAGSHFYAATPTDSKFNKHIVNLVITVDTNLAGRDSILRSITVNDVPLYNHPQAIEPTLLNNEVVETLYFARVSLTTTASAITVNAPDGVGITGYIYGYGQVDSYGWPILGSRKGPYPYTDTLEPVITEVMNSNLTGGSQRVMHYRVTELRNDPDPIRDQPLPTDQVESGIMEITLEDHLNNGNAVLENVTKTILDPQELTTAYEVKLSAKDSTIDIDVTIHAKDRVGNIGSLRVTKQGLLRLNPIAHDYGRIILNAVTSKQIMASNHSTSAQEIVSYEQGNADIFKGSSLPAVGYSIAAADSIGLLWNYHSDEETTNYRTDLDEDVIRVNTTAGYSTLLLKGVAGTFLVQGEDLDFGIVPPASAPKCLDVILVNVGSFPVKVDSISGFAGSPFEFNVVSNRFTNPIEPGESRKVGFACYDPVDTDGDTVEITIHSRENRSADSVVRWVGNVTTTSVDDVNDPDDVFSAVNNPPFIQLSVPPAVSGSIVVSDLVGNQVTTLTVQPGRSTMQIDTGGWTSGTYVITFICNDSAYTRLIQVMR